MRGFFALLRMTSKKQKQIPFGNDKTKGERAKADPYGMTKNGMTNKGAKEDLAALHVGEHGGGGGQ